MDNQYLFVQFLWQNRINALIESFGEENFLIDVGRRVVP